MSQLDPEQHAAVESNGRITLVTSPPGSGKTTVVVARTRYMLTKLHISPYRIALLTFTRNGANEMRLRLGDLARGIFIGTFHGWGLSILMEMGGSLGYQRDWLSIISPEEASLDQREVLAEFGLIRKKPDGGFDWREIPASAWELFVDRLTSGKFDYEAKRNSVDERLLAVWGAYVARLRSQNVLSFQTILTEAYELLGDKKVLAHFQNKYQHIIMDEAQDSDSLQFGLIHKFMQKIEPTTMFIVGDLDQSIFQWRLAEPTIMLGMAKNPEVTLRPLKTSYRFGNEIGSVSQALIQHNVERIPQEIIAAGPPGRVDAFSDVTEIGLVKHLARLVDVYEPKNVFVIARTHAVLEWAERHLAAAGIPVARIGSLGAFRKTAEFRTCVGYLRLMMNPDDRRGFMAVTAAEGFTRSDILAWRDRSSVEFISLSKASGLQERIPDGLDALAVYLPARDPNGQYGEALEYLQKIAFYEGLQTPQELINWLALSDIQDELRQVAGDKVVLMTGHCAKGMENDCVVVLGLNEGLWPSSRSENEGRLEEERRLCYVAMTRAKKHLVLMSLARIDEGYGQQLLRVDPPASRFVSEIHGAGVRA